MLKEASFWMFETGKITLMPEMLDVRAKYSLYNPNTDFWLEVKS